MLIKYYFKIKHVKELNNTKTDAFSKKKKYKEVTKY